MSDLIPFNFNGQSVQVITGKDGEPWFVASHVCNILDHTNTSMAISRLDDDEKLVSTLLISGQNREALLVNESGLYSIIMTSRKPEAKAFKKWVTSEVLPSIRKTGSYSLKPMTPLELARAQVALFEKLEQVELERDIAIQTKAEIGCKREATAMNTASHAVKKANQLEVQLDKSMEYITIKRMEMIHHGQKFNWRLLKSAGAEMGIDAVDVFDQNYGTVKGYHASVWQEAYAITCNP